MATQDQLNFQAELDEEIENSPWGIYILGEEQTLAIIQENVSPEWWQRNHNRLLTEEQGRQFLLTHSPVPMPRANGKGQFLEGFPTYDPHSNKSFQEQYLEDSPYYATDEYQLRRHSQNQYILPLEWLPSTSIFNRHKKNLKRKAKESTTERFIKKQPPPPPPPSAPSVGFGIIHHHHYYY
jgi:hypothetical protein